MKNKILIMLLAVSVGYNVYQSQGKKEASTPALQTPQFVFRNFEELKRKTESAAKKLDQTNPAHAEQLRRMIAEIPVDIPQEMAQKMSDMPRNITEAKALIAKNEILLKEINRTLDKKQQ